MELYDSVDFLKGLRNDGEGFAKFQFTPVVLCIISEIHVYFCIEKVPSVGGDFNLNSHICAAKYAGKKVPGPVSKQWNFPF